MNNRSDDLLNMPTDRKLFRDRLVARMREKKLTGAELARKAKLSEDAIGTYTTMRSLPKPKTLAKIADALGCKPTDLLPLKPITETVLELREHSKAGYRVLVVKMPLPTMDALKHFKALAELEEGLQGKKGNGDTKD